MTLYESQPGYFYDDDNHRWSLFRIKGGWRLEDLAHNTRSDYPSFDAAVKALRSHVGGDVKVHYKQGADSSPQDRREHIKWALVGARAFSKALKKHNETGDPGSILEAFKHAYGVEINLKDAGLEEFAQMWGQARTHLKQDIVRTMTPTKKALLRLANENPEFKRALVAEIKKEAREPLRDMLSKAFQDGRKWAQQGKGHAEEKDFLHAMRNANKYFAKMQKLKDWSTPLGPPLGTWYRLGEALDEAALYAGMITEQKARGKAAGDKQADKWEGPMPKGWTDESRKKFWDSLTSRAPKHKVTQCIKRMEKHMDDPGAFCASLADRVMPGWREEAAKDRKKKKASSLTQPLSLRRDYGSDDEWLDIGEVAALCPSCATKMARNNIKRVRASTLRLAMQRR